MGDWPLLSVSRFVEDDTVYADGVEASFFQTLAVSGVANTKGAYTQFVASAAFDVCGILLNANLNPGDEDLIDIAVGAPGSEVDVIPNIPISNFRTNTVMDVVEWIPIYIPKGSRISMRVQSTNASPILQVKLQLLGDPFYGIQPPTRWKDWGTDLANSTGATIAGSAGAKGAFTQLVASSEFSTRWVMLCMLEGGSDDYVVDFAIGTQVVIPNIRNTMQNSRPFVILPWGIPAKSQIQMRIGSINGISIKGMMLGGG
jgi:hypothetical protein